MAGEPRRGPSAQSSLRGPHRLLAWAWEVVVQALAASPGHAEADGLARKRTVSPGGRSPVSQARPRPGAWRPARRKGSQEGHAAEACSALCGRVPLGWGFPDLGGGVWEHAQSCPGHPSLSPSARHPSKGVCRPGTCARSNRSMLVHKHQPSLTASLPASPWPPGCGLPKVPGCAVFSWLPVTLPPVGPTQDFIEGNGTVGPSNPSAVTM